MELALPDKKPTKDTQPYSGHKRPRAGVTRPDWAQGLRQLYDSVVEEPLPDSFDELLRKLGDT